MAWFLVVLIVIYELPSLIKLFRWVKKQFFTVDPILSDEDLKDLKKPGQGYCDRDEE